MKTIELKKMKKDVKEEASCMCRRLYIYFIFFFIT